jgi:probable F420-dependent oxidoreductase
MHPFRFAVQCSIAADGGEWRAKARKVEAVGYSTLFVPDHLDRQWGPLVAMTAAVEATKSLKVGSLVFANDYRHPMVLAKEIATLDLLSEGRVEFGLGAGWLKRDYAASGIDYERPGVRIDRLAQSLSIMKELWSTGMSTSEGEHYTISGAQGLPRTHSRPHPPVIVGGGGRRILSLAAREADIVGINPSLPTGRLGAEVASSVTAEAYAQRIEWIEQAAGERMASIELQCLAIACHVVPNRDEVLAGFAPVVGLTPEQLAQVPVALIGTVDQICETLIERRERYGFSYWVVQEHQMDAFAPVLERLAGR